MTREEYYKACSQAIEKSNCLLVEASTGFGKSKVAIDLVNKLCETKLKDRHVKMLLLVAKKVHKQTWRDEFAKWGGIKADEVVIECYESLRKHVGETFDIVVADEVHHLASEARKDLFQKVHFKYCIGLSATISRDLKYFFKWKYKSLTVSCNIVEAIEDDVLPEPEILLFPLQLNNVDYSEQWEVNPRSLGKVAHDIYQNKWKYIKSRQRAILSCTQKQKSNEFNAECLRLKNSFNRTRNEGVKNIWLQRCGQRLEFYSNCKVPIVKMILRHLRDYRTITFCKTIEQCEQLGKNCIHSKNGKLAEKYYADFNAKKIKHITAVNILNENANLVDCRYGIFGNLAASTTIQIQRTGRLLRHKHPVLILPYYEGTREEEVVNKMFENYNQDYIRTIRSIEEI